MPKPLYFERYFQTRDVDRHGHEHIGYGVETANGMMISSDPNWREGRPKTMQCQACGEHYNLWFSHVKELMRSARKDGWDVVNLLCPTCKEK